VTLWTCVRGKKLETVPIGRPISNVQTYILDHNLEPVPIGVSGELYIGGYGLARGYLNRPDLTAERFIPHPLYFHAGAHLYKTGDLARYLPDGVIEFLGRADHQVKLRGFRIEPGEVEAVLRQFPAIQECVVVARIDILVAYIVVRGKSSMVELRSFLQEKLPVYMVPSIFVELDALPLTTHGKVDLHALSSPKYSLSRPKNAFVPARTSTEMILSGIWSDLLGIKRVGVFDNFFELGGHSLLATQLVSRIRDAFKVDIPLMNIFQSPTVAGLALVLAQNLNEGKNSLFSGIRRSDSGTEQLLARLDQLSNEELDILLDTLSIGEEVNE
jgi:acyl carrier protein